MELNPKVFLAREHGLKTGFSVSLSPYSSPVPFCSYLPASSRPPVSSSPSHQLPLIILISFFARHFVTPDAAESAGYASRYRSRQENRQSNYAKNKIDGTAAAEIFYGRENVDRYAFQDRSLR